MAGLSNGSVHTAVHHHVAVVLAGDVDLALLQITHRDVAAPVTVGQFFRLAAHGQSQQLMAQTKTKQRDVAVVKLLHLGDDAGVLRGVAGTGRKDHSVIAAGQDRLCLSLGRQERDLAAALGQMLHKAAGNTKVQHGHVGSASLQRLGVGAGGLGYLAGDLVGLELVHHFGNVKMLGAGDQRIHAPLIAEDLGQRAGIHILNARNTAVL